MAEKRRGEENREEGCLFVCVCDPLAFFAKNKEFNHILNQVKH